MIIAISISALILLVTVALIVLGRREHAPTAAAHAEVLSMPIATARAKATALFRAGSFSTTPRDGDLDLSDLPADVGELLRSYNVISKHEFWVGRSGLSETSRLPGCRKIGGDADFEEILVKPGDEAVFLSYPAGFIGQNPVQLPSIWHKILLVATEEEDLRGKPRVA